VPPALEARPSPQLALAGMLTSTVRLQSVYPSRHEVTPQRSLFRQEAIEFQQHHRQWGELALLQPLSTKIMTWFITTGRWTFSLMVR
jgi:hypothetical protein